MINKLNSNKFLKKLSAFVLCTALLSIPLNQFVFAESLINEDSTKQFEVEEITVSQVDFTVENPSTFTTNQLKTNDGKAIESNIFKNNEDGGNNLFAIYSTIIDGVPCESYYFANEESIPENELRKFVYDSEAKKMDTYESAVDEIKNKTIAASLPTTYIKSYNWSFYDDGILQCTLSTNVSLTKQSGNVNYNGTTASLWDVSSFSQLEDVNSFRLNDQYTRLDLSSYSAEKLIDYGPVGNSSGGTISVGLDGLGIPSVQYSFSIDGFSVTDYSSLSGNYGRWHFWDGIGNLSRMVTQPGIRVTNTKGSLAIDLSQTTNIIAKSGYEHNHQTGIIQILVNDR